MSAVGMWRHIRNRSRLMMSSIVLSLCLMPASSSAFAATASAGSVVNLLSNPGFEAWKSGLPVEWTKATAATTVARSTTAHSGSYAADVTTSSKTDVTAGLNAGSRPTVESTVSGVTYSASCWTRASKITTIDLRLHEVTPAGASVAAAAVTSLAVPKANRWYQLRLAYTAKHNGDMLPFSIYDSKIVSGGATFLIDDCALSAKDTTPPTAPTNLLALAQSADKVTLTWSPATDNVGVADYLVLRAGATLASVSNGSRTYTDTDVDAGATYTYSVVAVDAAGNMSPPSTAATVTTLPTTPTGLKAVATSPEQVNLSWNASTSRAGITGYTIWRSGQKAGTVAGTNYVDRSLQPDGTYTYTVTASDAAHGTSAQSTKAYVTTPTLPPSLTAASPVQEATLNWSAVPGAVSYTVYRDGNKIGSTTAESYVDNTTPTSGFHAYAVTAVNAGGESAPSNTVSVLVDTIAPTIVYSVSPSPNADGWHNGPVTVAFTCTDNPGGSGVATCSAPVTLTTAGADQAVMGTATDNAGNTSRITAVANIDDAPPTLGNPSWSVNPVILGGTATVSIPVSDDLSGVIAGEYYMGDTDPGQGNGIAMTYANGYLSGSLLGLSPGTYTVNFRAEDAAGNWSPVTTATLTVDQPPAAPTDLEAYATSPTQIDLAWTAATPGSGSISSYEITRTGSDGSTATFESSGPATTYQDTGLSTGVTYSYTVQAVDIYGISGVSSNSAADTPPAPGSPYTPTQWHDALYAVIHDDVAQSTAVTLPNGNVLWTFGDATEVNEVSTVSAYGYPHDAFVTQEPGTLNFTAVHGPYGYGWQQVPNWPDGSQFWMSTPIVDGNTLYVFGERVQVVSATQFTVLGSYVAEFDANTLAYEGVVQIPGGATGNTVWGGITQVTVDGTAEWMITGTHNVACSYATDCKVGDVAFVPFGDIADSSAWQVDDDVVPASANIGTSLGIIQTDAGWIIYTKVGDAYGGTSIEQLTSSSITGPWTVSGTWSIPSPAGSITYGVTVHPEQASPPGLILVSYGVNGPDDGVYPYEEFLYLPR